METSPPSGEVENAQLRQVLERLLNTTELNLDDLEDETRDAIQDALRVLSNSET